MTRVAECHARLCLRREVILDDAVNAVYLQEENGSMRGMSALGWKSKVADVGNLMIYGDEDDDAEKQFEEFFQAITQVTEAYA